MTIAELQALYPDPPTAQEKRTLVVTILQVIDRLCQQATATVIRATAVAQAVIQKNLADLTQRIGQTIATLVDKTSATLGSVASRIAHDMAFVHCAAAADAVLWNDGERLARFTKHVVKLPDRYQYAVAQALWEARWRRADNPIAYVKKTTILIYNHYLGDTPTWKEEPQKKYQEISLSTPLTDDLTLEDMLAAPGDPFAEAITVAEWAPLISQLSVEDQEVLHAKLAGISRESAPAALGWSLRKATARWRKFDRHRPEFQKIFAPVLELKEI